MKSILLANIGNRNLTYQGKNIPNPRFDQPGQTFRERTQELLADYEDIKADLDEQILSVLIAHLGVETIEKVVLFASDNQIDGDRNNQDTTYEAQLLKHLWAEQRNLQVEIITFTRNVTHNDDLLRFYRDTLRPYQATNTPIIICDAGGTAQQKAALKIAAEYLLDPSRYLVRYVDSGKIIPVEQVEYRRIIDSEQARSLITVGQYRSALLLRGFKRVGDAVNASNMVDKLMLFGYARFNRLDDLIQKVAQGMGKKINQFPTVLATHERRPAIGEGLFSTVLSEEYRFVIGEILLKIRFLAKEKRYNEVILTLAVMYETYLYAVIWQVFGYDLLNKYHDEKTRLLGDWSSFFPAVTTPTDLSVPVEIDLCQQVTDKDHNRFLTLLNGRISRGQNSVKGGIGLNTIRNKVAHNGLYVSDEVLKSSLPYLTGFLNELYELFGLPDDDPYQQLNRDILNIL